jgi:hypothetical protein
MSCIESFVDGLGPVNKSQALEAFFDHEEKPSVGVASADLRGAVLVRVCFRAVRVGRAVWRKALVLPIIGV